jgi:hypothetical protein
MPRISKEYLSSRITQLNAGLGRPVLQFASLPSESTRFSNGHICLDKNSQGYAIEEQLGESGATHCVSNRMSGSEMDIFLSGIMIGITYRNEQLIKNGHMTAM